MSLWRKDPPPADEPPLRAELFSREQMEQHGVRLATTHRLSPRRRTDRLLARLAANERVLVDTCHRLTEAVAANHRITPAGEWLLDNLYLIEEQVRTARRHFPEGYSRDLPRLETGPSAGLPRVYDIALAAVAHGDGRVRDESLRHFVAAYQSVVPLRLGELWAMPIMLRLALIENLRRVAVRVAAGRRDRDTAVLWADALAESARQNPKSTILTIADMARSQPPMTTPFVSELARRLQGRGPALALALTWVEQHLADSGMSIEHMVRAGNEGQAADHVSVSNSIGSLRFLGTTDWRDFVEAMSVVEQVLRDDPEGSYANMDFASRDRYRHVIEDVARSSGLPERAVAEHAIHLARAAGTRAGSRERETHVGFYLIDRGLSALAGATGVRSGPTAALRRVVARAPLATYLGAIAVVTGLLTRYGLLHGLPDGAPAWAAVLFGGVVLLAASQPAVSVVNALTMRLVSPRTLPRMDYSKGIPAESRTLVVVPTMLTRLENVEHLVEAMEVRFLANRDGNLLFGLLTDFPDAAEQDLDEDQPILLQARARVEDLNARYADAAGDRFFLFHRPRRRNAMDGVWMGHERKRGKLSDLNRLLLGGGAEAFSLTVGDTAALAGVRYVITLDTDTELPRDAARVMAGAMAHPLHRPVYDTGLERVCEGYGILQPRVSPSLPGATRSRYARLNAGEPGIDPYTRAVSDVYQDAFGEGSFIGKGIYHVEAFERALHDRLPENRILSHDLVEGCYARAGLLSDVELYEATPARYGEDVDRRFRWIRGDWQLLPWLLPWVRGSGGSFRRTSLSALSRWKLLDNLRRSLIPAAMLSLLLMGWAGLAPAWFWTLAVVGAFLVPLALNGVLDASRVPEEMRLVQHLATTARAAGQRLVQALLALTWFPHEAFYTLGAILRTLWRLLVTHRGLLEWNPSKQQERLRRADLLTSFASMWIGPALGAAATLHLAVYAPSSLAVASPLVLLWLASPIIAWWMSRPLPVRQDPLLPAHRRFLGGVARKTWAYFETCVGPDDHWLPPDNYQEGREVPLAHRTSPTNMGLALLANLTAHDLGYIPAGELLERTHRALETMGRLRRFRGHFYNWYDTRSLEPLHPAYVSTVDSGNLAGHLLAFRPGLDELAERPILDGRWMDGVRDTLHLVEEETSTPRPESIRRFGEALDAATAAWPGTLTAARATLDGLVVSAQAVSRDVGTGGSWARAMERQCRALRDEVAFLAPWTATAVAPAGPGAVPAYDGIPTLRALAELEVDVVAETHDRRPSRDSANAAQRSGMAAPGRLLALGSARARARMATARSLARQAGEMADMEYDFLYDKASGLLSIGYNADERRRDASSYDLLASEARLGVYVAVAQGRLPQESWFALGRLLTRAAGAPILLSWSGSMFEYLMPHLVMPCYPNTLLSQTASTAVARQMEYGKERGVPWGVSESGYNTMDAQLNYQYRAFGVPGLGLKRGLAEDMVVAPYASALALMVAPVAACANLQRLAAEGADGPLGLFEAIDYTPSRQRRGEGMAVVRAYMAHHQGMTLLALSHVLLDRPMQRRFEADRMLQSSLLLLQERIPRASSFYAHTTDLASVRPEESSRPQIRTLRTPHTPVPEVQLLSNGRYHVMVTNAGGGYTRWGNMAVTRWREDGTRDPWGTYCWLRDVETGEAWTTAHRPGAEDAEHYQAIFSEGRAEFRRRDGDFETHTEIVVSPEDDIELRRVHITNRSRRRRTLEVTTYAEVVLADPAADSLHPAFSNLFVETEFIEPRHAILCTRRPRSPEESAPWMFHLIRAGHAAEGSFTYDSDRAAFIGRGRSASAPRAMDEPGPLSASQGSVLDPVAAIRCRVTVEAESSLDIDLVYGVAATRADAMAMVARYQERRLANRVFDLAWTHAQVVLRQINATDADAQLYGRLANSVIYAHASKRAASSVLRQNRRGQSGLWGYAVSGDLPIVLLRIADVANIELVRQAIQAHAYWRLKGLAVDLVIWNEDRAGYRKVLQERILDLVAVGVDPKLLDRPGGIFVRSGEQISEEDRTLFQAVARVVLCDAAGTLAEQVDGPAPADVRVPALVPSRSRPAAASSPETPAPRELILDNGLGGFTRDGREYVITTTRQRRTPAPWVNVLANPFFGSVVSESGQAYTWGENAHELRLTPWHNDPLSDASGEAFFLRDEETGRFWSPTPLPRAGATPYVSRHGFGYSVFEHAEDGIVSELWTYVASDAAVKFSVLKVRNASGRARRLSATGYVEWVLGDLQARTAMHVTTELDPGTRAILARNPYNTEFPDRVAFFDADDAHRTVTCDRCEFIGRNGSLEHPAALSRTHLSGRVGSGLDPCAAIQVPFDLDEGQERQVTFMLGLGGVPGGESADRLVRRFRGAAPARRALEQVWQYWNHTLGAVQVDTPDESLNVLTNGWLLYQTISSRLWGRSGYYQSGGAFGFRDQLQDVMALVHAEPGLARSHLLLCAGRQFREGDVQHWWHPPSGKGVRTHCSDDYLWLALATCRYVLGTGDTGVLDHSVPYLDGRPLDPADDSYYDQALPSSETESLYLHCVRAIRRGLTSGTHGLPLIGTGDWNDGLNRVGIEGRGESVWLAFFQAEVLRQFGVLARRYGDADFAETCAVEGRRLRDAIERHGWDGAWYRRAYFDDGTPLGSAENTECRIDAISQSWAVLSGAADPARARQAMESLDRHLVRREHALVQLLDPPFDKSDMDPGYIMGYVPGVRENGGQYTHSAIWAAMAFAALGDGRRAWELATMINPANHAATPDAVEVYKVEPYVVAADVYAVAPHVGRGGWTWYTGSAAWMYRLVLESLLGLRLDVDRLHVAPCLPAHWSALTIHYRHRETVYHIAVVQVPAEADAVPCVTVDGVDQEGSWITLVDDRREHGVEVRVTPSASPPRPPAITLS